VYTLSSPVSIQTQSLALLRCVNENRKKRNRLRKLPTMIGCLPTQALAFPAVFVYATYATHATQAIAFGWKPGFTVVVMQQEPKASAGFWLDCV